MSPRIRPLLMTTTALLALGPAPLRAGPDGPAVVGGSASISGTGTANVNVNQFSSRAIINWNTFNIGKGETTTFAQPSATSIILNRVTGGQGPSAIYGTINANGRVFLINRDGMLFGPSAVINTAGFLATTADIKNRDFMAGRLNFSRRGAPDASIVNEGRITATSGGFAALVAPGVRNSGTITATLGTVSLASGNMFTLDMYGDRLIQLGVKDEIAAQVKDVATGKPLTSLVTNDGKIRANGGRIELTAAAARAVVDSVINTKGVLEANTIGTRKGMIVLGAATGASKPKGAPAQTVKVSGVIRAAGRKAGTAGGTVVVTGENIQVAHARINASGQSGGGKVLIGGDWGGGKPTSGLVQNKSAQLETYTIPTATTLTVDGTSRITATGKGAGDGGKVVLWSDSETTFAGVIEARGGRSAGDGGFVEVSSHGLLTFAGSVDTRAPAGAAGTLLLDPYNVIIDDGSVGNSFGPGTDTATTTLSPTGPDTHFTTGQIASLLATNNVVVTTGSATSAGSQNGDITVASSVNLNWTAATTLTLSAYHDIVFQYNARIASGNADHPGAGSLVLRADNSGTGSGKVTFQDYYSPQLNFAHSSGMVSIYYNPNPVIGNPTTVNYEHPTNYASAVTTNANVPSQLTSYMLVNNAADLQHIGFSRITLDQTYALGKDIDATTFAGYAADSTFTGTLDGNGGLGTTAAIDHLGVGLFPVIGTKGVVHNLTLSNVAIVIAPTPFTSPVGALAGENSGSIVNISASGSIQIGGAVSGPVGGLVASNQSSGFVSQSNASVELLGGTTGSAGGLVGENAGTINQSHATGAITNLGLGGGLVGSNSGTISQSYATGSVSSVARAGGGFVGSNSGTIMQSYATGFVQSGTMEKGGLVGINSGTITQSYATGSIGGGSGFGGGLVGGNSGTITQSYATGSLGGGTLFGGGLVGDNSGTISQSYATGSLAGGPGTNGGLVGSNSGTITQSYATGSLSIGLSFASGGLVGSNSGTISESFAVGSVPTVPGNFPGTQFHAGGLVGTNTGTVTNSYWDTQTSGQATSAGGTGLTTAQLQAGLRAGFSSATWGIVPGVSYPYLKWQFPNGTPQVVSGIAYSDHGATPVAGGTVVAGLIDGVRLQSALTGGSASTGANGYFYYLLAPGTIAPNAQVGVGTWEGGTIAGGTYRQNAAGSTTGLDIYGGYLREITGASSLSALNTGLATAIGSFTNVATIVNALPNRQIDANGASFTLDQAISLPSGTLVLNAAGAVIQSAPLVVGNLALLGTTTSYTLTNAGNQIGTLAANTGALNLADSRALTIGAVVGTNGVSVTGAFTLNDNGNAITATAPVSASVFTLAGGNWTQNAAALPAFSVTDFRISGGSFLRVAGGDGSAGNPYRPTDIYGLQGITASVGSAALLAKSYVLANDLDLAPAAAWNAGAGFRGGGTYTGVFDGATHTISGLALQSGTSPSSSPAGLFGFIGAGGTVKNLNLANVSIVGNTNTVFLGALAGENDGTIANVTVSGTINGGAHSGVIAGGLVGQNRGTITQSVSTVNVSVGDAASSGSLNIAGSLVGSNLGTITLSSASGAVSGGNNSLLGGLVGQNGLFGFGDGVITDSHASGNVSVSGSGLGSGFNSVGGLVGAQQTAGSTITNSYANGNVSAAGPNTSGGLVGFNTGTITNAQAFGTVTATNTTNFAGQPVGGLVGRNNGTITNAQASGTVTANSGSVGGLVGDNSGTITNAQAFGSVSAPFGNIGGFVGINTGTITNAQTFGATTGTNASVGGLVGFNTGTITGTSTPSASATCTAGAAFSCAAGAVTLNGVGYAGGVVGINALNLANSVATGAVVTTDGIVSAGGLIGWNFGSITTSFATGNVSGGPGSTLGGLVGNNNGTITTSFATGNVSGGPGSTLGGLVGLNFGDGSGTNSTFGSITDSHATGTVTGGANSIAGGFFGVNLFGAISTAYSTGAVTAGTGSTAGGFGGLNIGTIDVAFTNGAVTAGDGSFVGGFVGVNFTAIDANVAIPNGVITQAYALGPATGGANSFVAGFAAINVGSLDQTYAGGLVTAGPGSTTGGLVASNSFNYTLPADIALLDPPGTATNSYWDRQTTGQTASAGGAGFDTAVLSSGLPNGFDPGAWSANAGQYPFLAAFSFFGPIPGLPVLPATPTPPLTDVIPVTPVTIPGDAGTTPVASLANLVDTLANSLPSQQRVVQDINRDPAPSPTSITFAQLVNTQAVTQPLAQPGALGGGQSSGQPARQQNQQPGATPATGFGSPPIRLDVGAGRFFYLPPVGETRIVQNEVVLQMACNVAPDSLAAASRAAQFTVLSSQCLGASNLAVYRVQVGSGQTLASTIRGLAAHRIVVAAQANYLYELAQDQGEPAGSPDQYVIDKLSLHEIHRLVKGTNVSIAVIDSEIDVTHPDLAGAITTRYDATQTEDRPHPHGTGMAGAIGSHQKLLGVAPGARLLAIRAFSSKAASAESTTFNILKGLDYAVNNSVRIVNMSFAGPKDPSFERALKTASDKGLILIAAAGNAGPKSPPLYPAADPHVIAVTATDMDDKVFSGANRGKYVAIAAPGVDILVPAPAGTYQLTTGTSVATAHVSGTVALLLERNPRLTPAEVRRILTQTAKKLGPATDYGAGLINPLKALELAGPKTAALPPPAQSERAASLASAR